MRYLTTIKLRKEHEIFENKDKFLVEMQGRDGEIFKREISKDIVKVFTEFLNGNVLSCKEAQKKIMSSDYVKHLYYKWGHKRQYEVQDILLCIVASGHGRIHKEGKKYVYEIY